MNDPIDLGDFFFLKNSTSAEYLKKSLCMFIMRGLPGSGKSTIAKQIIAKYEDSKICSADDYFLQSDGSYIFDESKLKIAHKSCQINARMACAKKVKTVVIDNTNIRKWEANNYLDIARDYGYIVFIVEPKTPWKFDVDELMKRSVHRIQNYDKMKYKVESFDTVLPKYYAWMFNAESTDDFINCGAKHILNECLTSENFKNTFNEFVDLSRRDICSYFTRKHFISSAHNVHCTAMFDGSTYNPTAFELERARKYATLVGHLIGTIYKLKITGFIITPKTYSALVELDEEQLKLYVRDEESEVTQAKSNPSVLDVSNQFAVLDLESQPEEERVNLPRGCRAHITLGCCEGVAPVAAGDEVLKLAITESVKDCEWSEKCDRFEIKYFGNGNFKLMLDSAMYYDTIFSGSY